MNAVGVICRILLAIFFCGAQLVVAQQLKPSALDLVYKSLDLESPVRELKAESENLQGSSKTAVAEPGALVAPPSQLVSPAMEVKESATEVKINLLGDILFDFDRATIRSAAEPTLAQVAALIRKYPNSTVLIEGHTDGKGSDTYNLKLSEKRADSVRTWLSVHGITEGAMRTGGLGAATPVAPNRKPNGA